MIRRPGETCSRDLQVRVFALADRGGAIGKVAGRLCVSVSHVPKVLSRRRTTGETAACRQRCHIP